MGAYSASILGCLGPRLRADERAFFADAQPWGFILFARNLEAPDQVRRLTDGLRDAVGWNAPILIDQEGGRVQRMGPPHWRQWIPPLEQVERAGEHAERVLYLRSLLIGAELSAVGIDVNCAPMADIAEHATHPFLKNRCYGTDKDIVAKVGRAVADGLLASGVLPVLKHIPGHGRANVDSHLQVPRVDRPVQDLQNWDFAPFRALSDLKLGMTAHILFSAIDADHPATQSKAMIKLIREQIGFGGLLMTDDISMEALDGDLSARAARSISAGCDLVLHCNGELAEMAQIVTASGAMSEDAVTRGQVALADRVVQREHDLTALAAEFAELTGTT